MFSGGDCENAKTKSLSTVFNRGRHVFRRRKGGEGGGKVRMGKGQTGSVSPRTGKEIGYGAARLSKRFVS